MQHTANDGNNAAINNVTSATEVVAAPGAGLRIIVLGYKLQLDTDGEYTWSSDATPLTGAMQLAADAPDGAFFSAGVFRCAEDEPLVLEATTPANGWVRYVIARA